MSTQMNKVRILDACCGSRMFWFNKKEPHTTYMDIREESLTLCDGRTIEVKPVSLQKWKIGNTKSSKRQRM